MQYTVEKGLLYLLRRTIDSVCLSCCLQVLVFVIVVVVVSEIHTAVAVPNQQTLSEQVQRVQHESQPAERE